MSTNFELAPPPKVVDGLTAVPIDIASIDAALTFDAASQTATGDATITYEVGPTAGCPIFDLRQTITNAWLDGAPLAPSLLAHHTFGTGALTDLRVIESVQAAGSIHTLQVQYSVALPDSQLGGSYLPALDWLAGPSVRFVFGLSDLNRARYVEAWLPANLIFDQYSIDLDIQVLNTMASHSVITNGALTSLGPNHWAVAFPDRFSAVSPMLELRASSTVTQATGAVTLPVSGATVTIEAWKPTGSAVDLPAQISAIGSLLTENESDYGAYLHGNRFVAFFNGGGMEYEGGTTTSTGALAHETFHSWFARGIKPASQADGWWDEAYTSFHDDGADDPVPLDFTLPPVVLCSRDPWQRHTPTNAYSDGSALFRGLASMLGVATLNLLMGELYKAHKGGLPVSTARLEEFLVSRSGNPAVVSAFHRFVYGLANPLSPPDLWIRDAAGDPGVDAWGGEFWDSPDLWIRNADDDVTIHQSPEHGQDNWFHARVRNKAGAGAATHFVVTFHARGFAGTEFLYPNDFLPSIAAKAEFDLPPGETRIVKARWPRHLVPSPGTHTCLLASILTRSDLPIAGRHVWEHNNLAQKNLTVVDMAPNEFLIVPIVIANWSGDDDTAFELELLASPRESRLAAGLIHRSRTFFARSRVGAKPFRPPRVRERPHDVGLDCGGHLGGASAPAGRLLTSDEPELIAKRFPDSWEAPLGSGERLPVEIDRFSQTVVGLKVAVAPDAKPGRATIHFVQRQTHTSRIVGGVAIQVDVRDRDR